MRVENARLGVETITRKGLTARSATKPRSSSSIDQWRTARPERNRLEKIQQGRSKDGEQFNPTRDSTHRWMKERAQVTPSDDSSSTSTTSIPRKVRRM
jgi:hypothetical protein